MKYFAMIMLSVLAFSVSACKTTAENHDGKITIEDSHHRSGDFCPPGQAKHGNC